MRRASKRGTSIYSTRYFCFVETDADIMHPDVLIPARLDDMVQNKDSVLEWVMQDTSSASTD
ncbi:MAG: hypothetical protein AAGA39_05970 [Pseudomonadota bacterium]